MARYDTLLWREFRAWVVGKATEYHAKYWSATVEESRHGDEPGRIHFHCYFSWHGLSASGVDRQTTNAWVFRGVSPRVDANAENRGPSWWLKAAQHGHFYVAVMKEGTLEAVGPFCVRGRWRLATVVRVCARAPARAVARQGQANAASAHARRHVPWVARA